MKVKYFKPWILFFIVASLGGAIAGGIAGVAVGIIMGISGFGGDHQMLRLGGQIAGYLAAIPVSFFVYKWSVNRFVLKQVVPVPVEQENTSNQESDPT